MLRRARVGRGLTLEQISNETKIPHRRLEALEHDNMALVSGEFYRRAEIRAYARAVRLDPNIALAELERALRPPAAPGPIVERPKAQDAALFSKRALIGISVIVAAAVFPLAMGERQPGLDRNDRVRIATGSPKHHVTETPLGVGISQRTQLDRAAPPVPASDGSPAFAMEPTGVGASPASNDNVPVTTDQDEARVFADSVTELVVTTEPAGARVTVNGIGWGIAPVTVRYLPAGHKRIRVTKEGYATEERMVHVAEGRPRMVEIQLRSAP